MYLATPGCDTGSLFKRGLTGLDSEFYFSSNGCQIKAEEYTLSWYLPLAGGRILGSYLSQVY